LAKAQSEHVAYLGMAFGMVSLVVLKRFILTERVIKIEPSATASPWGGAGWYPGTVDVSSPARHSGCQGFPRNPMSDLTEVDPRETRLDTPHGHPWIFCYPRQSVPGVVSAEP